MRYVSRIDRLELDLDIRLRDMWAETAGVEEWTLEIAAPFMRACYGKGYCDALAEAERGELHKTHGFRTPKRGELKRAA